MKKIFIITGLIFIFTASFAESNENPFVQNEYNPDISLIADFAFISSDIKDESREHLEIPEFAHHPPHTHMNKGRGLNFNYLELSFAAPVDPYFDIFAVSTIAPGHGIEVEEVYADTKFLPYGFGLRLGLFKSDIGRHNSKHAHAWDFYDSPIIYDTLLGTEGISNMGVRLTYTLPVDFLLMAGAEIFQGSFGEPISFNANGFTFLDKEIEPFSKPALYTGYLKTSFDFGDHIFLLGASTLYGQSNLIHSHHHEGEVASPPDHAISASDTILYGFDLTYKYIIDAYRYLSIEGEYLNRAIDGDLYLTDNKGTEDVSDDVAIIKGLNKVNSGLYVQSIFKFNYRMRTGVRLDYLLKPEKKINGEKQDLEIENLYKISFMLEYNHTEFSRFRFQYNYDHTKYFEEKMLPIQEFIFSYNFAIGAHGAHAF